MTLVLSRGKNKNNGLVHGFQGTSKVRSKIKSYEKHDFDINHVTARFESLNLRLTLVGSNFKQEDI